MRIGRTNRREFIVGLGGATAWPVVARAQQTRRIGVLMSSAADDPQGQAHVKAFQQGLQQLGWTDGANVRIDVRSSAGDPNSAFKHAAEMVALSPDVLVAFAS